MSIHCVSNWVNNIFPALIVNNSLRDESECFEKFSSVQWDSEFIKSSQVFLLQFLGKVLKMVNQKRFHRREVELLNFLGHVPRFDAATYRRGLISWSTKQKQQETNENI